MAVYILRQGMVGSVKIGSTNDPRKRQKQLQTGQGKKLYLMRLLEGSGEEERALHKRFAALKLNGEWFRFHVDMMGDLGLPALPLPPDKVYGPRNWPQEPWLYEAWLHREIVEIISASSDETAGHDYIARRCGLSPVEVHLDEEKWWGVLILLLREKGCHEVTYQLLRETRRAVIEERKQKDQRASTIAKAKEEAVWLRRHPGVVPWWPIYEENRSVVPNTENIVPLHAAEVA